MEVAARFEELTDEIIVLGHIFGLGLDGSEELWWLWWTDVRKRAPLTAGKLVKKDYNTEYVPGIRVM